MGEVADQTGSDVMRREIEALLAEIDTELAGLVRGERDFEARAERVKRRLTGPAFLIGPASHPDPSVPLVSVVLPTRDRAASIGDAIRSVQAQSFASWELIIVDDGSRDRTSEVVAAFLPDRRIRYVVQEASGHAAARNRAVSLSHGALIAYIDSDNLWYPHFLDAAVTALAALAEIDCVYGALVTEAHPQAPRTILFEAFDWRRLLRANYIDLNTVVHRRSLIESYGGFDEGLSRLVDWDLLLRVTREKPAFRVPVLAAHYRVVDDQRVSVTCPFESNYDAIQRKWSVSAGDRASEAGAESPDLGLAAE
ncbi:glycosyltransferase family 2 protein [Methyloceanibacter sp.]|uniref:glycosyltransferase family 2 protein n=1 Tax=Methyloceanibacter sp. TaxID=1965321 RepID=UPI003D6D05B9